MLEILKSQTGINSIFADKKQGTGKWFDLSGRKVGNGFKGLVINKTNGKKFVNK